MVGEHRQEGLPRAHLASELLGHDPRDLGEIEVGRALKSFEKHGRESLMAALSVYDAVVTTLANSKVRDLHRFGQGAPEEMAPETSFRMPALQKNAG